MAGLDDILNPPEETEETGQEVVEETQEETTGAEETQVAAETKEETPPATDTAEQVRAELAALTKERQRLREKEAAWEQERQQFLAQRQPAKEDKPDFWENPEQIIDQKTSAVQEELARTKIEMSEAFVREMKPDYDEKLATFLTLAQHDPSLVQKMRQAANPAGFAYKAATDHLKLQELQQIGDPAAYREKIEQELREKLRAEVEQEYAAKQEAEKKAAIEAKLSRGGFASERSVATSSAAKKSYNGPTPLDSILK